MSLQTLRDRQEKHLFSQLLLRDFQRIPRGSIPVSENAKTTGTQASHRPPCPDSRHPPSCIRSATKPRQRSHWRLSLQALPCLPSKPARLPRTPPEAGKREHSGQHLAVATNQKWHLHWHHRLGSLHESLQIHWGISLENLASAVMLLQLLRSCKDQTLILTVRHSSPLVLQRRRLTRKSWALPSLKTSATNLFFPQLGTLQQQAKTPTSRLWRMSVARSPPPPPFPRAAAQSLASPWRQPPTKRKWFSRITLQQTLRRRSRSLTCLGRVEPWILLLPKWRTLMTGLQGTS